MDLEKYWTYSDEFNQKLSYQKCLIKLHSIFRNYRRELFIKAISHISKKFGIDNDKKMILKIQSELFGNRLNQNVIHRTALSALYQFILEFRDFSKHDLSNIIKPEDLFNIFIIINEILDRFYDSFRSRSNELENIIFQGVHIFHDIISPLDINAKAFIMHELYKRMINDSKFADEIRHFNENSKYSFLEYVAYIEKMIKLIDNRTLFHVLVNNYAFNLDDILQKWDNRYYKINPPFDYKFLQDYPLVIIQNNPNAISYYYIILSFLEKAYHLCSNKKFRDNLGKHIFETIIKEFLRVIFISKEIKELNLKYNGYEYSDYGIIYEDKIILFEIKSGTIPISIKLGNDIDKFFEIINNKFIKKEGITQQINQLINIDNDFVKFCEVTKISSREKYEIYSVLLCFENAFDTPGTKMYFNQRFKEVSETKKFKSINFACSDNYSILTFTELFNLSTLEKYSNVEKLNLFLESMKDYQPLREFISDKLNN